MLRRYFVYLTAVLLFVLTQQAAVTHEISHITNTQQSSQKQEKTTHENFCEKCMSYGDIVHGMASNVFSTHIPAFSFELNQALISQHAYAFFTAYAARAPPQSA